MDHHAVFDSVHSDLFTPLILVRYVVAVSDSEYFPADRIRFVYSIRLLRLDRLVYSMMTLAMPYIQHMYKFLVLYLLN